MSNAKDKKPKAKKSVISRFLTMLLAAVILVSAAVNGYCIYDLFGRKVVSAEAASEKSDSASDDEGEDTGFKEIEQAAKAAAEEAAAEAEKLRASGQQSYSPTMIDVVSSGSSDPDGDDGQVTKVVDQNSAKEMLGVIAPDLGIKDVDEEYSCTGVIEQENYNYYIMKQNFNGIEVVGADLIMQADKLNGTLVNVGGNYQPVPEDLDTETTLSEDEIRKNVRTYAITNQPVSGDDLYIDIRQPKIFPIKPMGYAVCYEVVCSDSNGVEFTVAVEGKTGNILWVNDPVRFEMVSRQLDGQDSRKNLFVFRENDDLFYLRDTDRNLAVHVNNRSNTSISESDMTNLDIHSYMPNDEDASKRTPDKSAVDALANLQMAYDFYKNYFQRDGLVSGRELNIYVGINVCTAYSGNFNNNAAMCGGTEYIIIGTADSKEISYRVEVLGHEFTHGVIASYPNGLDSLGYGNEQNIINEGLADVFGELVEDYANNGDLDGNVDWVHGRRNFITPTENNYSACDPTTLECHDGSTLISGPFYKMVNAPQNAVPEKTFANLYYEILPTLTSSTSIPRLRELVENNAMAMNYEGTASSPRENHTLTDENMEVIIDAFDAFGIESGTKARVVKGGKLRVFDQGCLLCGNYNIKLYRPFDTGLTSPLFDQDVTQAGDFILPESIKNGYYTMVLTDLSNTRNTAKQQILINDNSSERKTTEYPEILNVYTKFNSEAKDVVLVLDSSGSMEGTPISQARASSKRFVETVLESNPTASISLISYNSSVDTRVTASNSKSKLESSINKIRDGGRTDIYDALDAAKGILEKSTSKKKLIVLLSDGLPNEGPSDNGDHYAPIYRLSDEMKAEGIVIYSLGFFHNLYGSELSSGQEMMSKIASEGYYYVIDKAEEVGGVASDLELAFNDFAEMFNGKNFVNIRIACPVDVTVTYNGETLTSDEKNPVTRTSFGTISYEKIIDEETGQESEDKVKVLRLDESADYEICITGTGKGKMDYTISFPNEDGEYTDVREFKRVPITKDTVVATSTKQQETVDIKVDTDGDGSFDLNYEAEKNKKGEETSGDNTLKIILIVCNSVAGAGLLAYLIIMLIGKSKTQKAAAAPAFCLNCASPLAENAKFCRSCGTPVPARPAPEPEQPVRSSKALNIVKLSLICVFTVFTVIVTNKYYSPATTVFKQLRDGQTASAKLMYNNCEGNSDKYISWLTDHHLSKAESAFKDGELTEAEYRTLLEGVKAIGIDDASDVAKEQLKELGNTSKEDSDSKSGTGSSGAEETSSEE